MNEPRLYNALELYAENAEQANEARKGWTARTLALDLMYKNIKGIETASLETKNFVYDSLLPIISATLDREEAERKKAIEAYLAQIKADYYRPTKTQPAYIVFFDYMGESDYLRRNRQKRKMLEAYTHRNGIKTDTNADSATAYFYIYA